MCINAVIYIYNGLKLLYYYNKNYDKSVIIL